MTKSSKTEKVENLAPKKKFKTVKKVTGIPFLVIETHKPVYIKFESNITLGLMKKKPAEFASVTNMETGELMKLLLGKVLSRQILENYPNETFVGKTFEIIRGEKVKGNENEYYEFEINEVEPE